MPNPDPRKPGPRPPASRKTGLHARDILLLIPLLGLLVPGVYARRDPMLFGFPFFYWYQFAWVFLTAAITGLVYFLVRDP
jgi:hypothetical protein